MNSLYLHIPYCLSRCAYCDFHSSICLDDKDEYVDALCFELQQRESYLKKNTLDTIYFGGGTPSVLSIAQLDKIFKTIKQYYSISPKAEITLEANPDDIDKAYLEGLRQLGFNRLSIGIQSFDDEDLALIGRRHSAQHAIDVVKIAQQAGFDNISCDLIFGLPYQTLEKWKYNLSQLYTLNIQHISCYNLSYEEGTAFYQKLMAGELKEIDDELSLEMFKYLIDSSKAQGFVHYETSNFAKEGLFSKHNSNYWSGEAYLGIGAGAHSYDGEQSRRWNISDNQQYIEGIMRVNPHFDEELIDQAKAYNEFIMTGLRTIWGCSISILEDRFGSKMLEYCLEAASPYLKNRQLKIIDNVITIDAESVFISDQIMSDLMIVD